MMKQAAIVNQLTPTIFVIEILMIKAASGLENPLVAKSFFTDSKNGGSFSPLMSFSSSELVPVPYTVKNNEQHFVSMYDINTEQTPTHN